MRKVAFVLCVLFAGCASQEQAGPASSSSSPSFHGPQIVVFRPSSTPAGRDAEVRVDGRLIGYLGQRQFISAEVAAGIHKVVVSFPKSWLFEDTPSADAETHVGEQQVVYFRYEPRAVFTATMPTAMAYHMTSSLSVLPEAQAAPEISKYSRGRSGS
jgi:hypothetical protein